MTADKWVNLKKYKIQQNTSCDVSRTVVPSLRINRQIDVSVFYSRKTHLAFPTDIPGL